jgi:hypothetical protein
MFFSRCVLLYQSLPALSSFGSCRDADILNFGYNLNEQIDFLIYEPARPPAINEDDKDTPGSPSSEVDELNMAGSQGKCGALAIYSR